MRSTTYNKVANFFKVFSGFIIAIPLFIAGAVQAATMYSSGSLLQPNDVTSSHIRDYTIQGIDMSPSAVFNLASTTSIVLNSGNFAASSTAKLPRATTIANVGYNFPTADGSNQQVLTTNGAAQLSWATLSQPYITTSFIAGEAIAAGDYVSVNDPSPTTVNAPAVWGWAAAALTNTYYTAGQFTTPASGLTSIFELQQAFHVFSGTMEKSNQTLSLYTDNAGNPGTLLGTATSTAGVVGPSADGVLVADLTTPITVTGSTKYWIVAKGAALAEPFNMALINDVSAKALYSSNSGSTWTVDGYTAAIGYLGGSTPTPYAYKASAASTNYRFNGAAGFAVASTTAGQSVTIQNFGYISLKTGLSVGQSYYLSNTNGAISTSPGTVSLLVGRALAWNLLKTLNP